MQSSGITKAEVARYNSLTQSWECFAYEEGRDLSEFCDFTQFDYGRGYEVYVESPCTLTISGVTPLTPKTLDLHPNWNLICAPTLTTISVEEALHDVTYNGVYERVGDAYVIVDTLQAGKGYFLKVGSPQTWNIPQEEEVITYVYDGDGGRVKRITEDETVTYIGSSYEVSQLAGSPVSHIKKHIFLGSTRICSVEYETSEPSNQQTYYFHQDHIGSSNIVTDATGAQVQLLEYTPYGLTSREEGEYNTDCRFTGKLFDTSTTLYYYGARYYDPELGRFISPDTIVPYPDDPQSFNRYAYARNNPIRYVDPTGHFWGIFAAIVGILQAISAIAAVIAGVAAVGALISNVAGNQSLAKTFSSIAMISGGVSLASGLLAAGGMSIIKANTILLEGLTYNAPGYTGEGMAIELPPIVIQVSSPAPTVSMGWEAQVLSFAQKMAASSIITSGVGAGSAVIGSMIQSSNLWGIGYEMGKTAAQGYSTTMGGINQFSTMSIDGDAFGTSKHGIGFSGEQSVSGLQWQTKTDISKTFIDVNNTGYDFRLTANLTKMQFDAYGEIYYKVISGSNELRLFAVDQTVFSLYYDVGYGAGGELGFITGPAGGKAGAGIYGGYGGTVELRWRNANRW